MFNNIIPAWVLDLEDIERRVNDGDLSYGSAAMEVEDNEAIPEPVRRKWVAYYDAGCLGHPGHAPGKAERDA